MRYLWRIDGSVDTSVDTEPWATGIVRHLRYQPLTVVRIWRAQELRRYLALTGCPRCRPDGCPNLCRRMLCAQLIQTTLPGLTLTPVAQLAPHDEERQHLLAVPASGRAQPLDAAFVQQWEHARVHLTWRCDQGEPPPLRVGAVIAVGLRGPQVGPALRARGWHAIPLSGLPARPGKAPSVPQPAPLHRRASAALIADLCDPQRWSSEPTTEACDAATLQSD